MKATMLLDVRGSQAEGEVSFADIETDHGNGAVGLADTGTDRRNAVITQTKARGGLA